ncbi:MAG: hypothetical protein P8184_16985 [Calditrichia bacterium]
MKNRIYFFALAIALCFMFLRGKAIAQEEGGNIYVVTTWKTVMPEGGSEAERDSLLQEWIEGTVEKNDKILSQKHLSHYYGSDLRDWVVIGEYKTWADIDEASKISQELAKKKWPDDKEREEFSRKLLKYFGTHSDEIYMEQPKFGK